MSEELIQADQIKLTVKNFRALADAQIALNGITVVTGNNSCGKSTLSKILYYTFNLDEHFDFRVKGIFLDRLRGIIHILEDALFYNSLQEKLSIENSSLIDIYKYCSEGLEELQNKGTEKGSSIFRHIRPFILSALSDGDFSEKLESLSTQQLIILLQDWVRDNFNDSMSVLQNRNLFVWTNEMKKVFMGNSDFSGISIQEFEKQLIDRKANRLQQSFFVRKTIYIDTPVMMGLNLSRYTYWNQLESFLKEKDTSNYQENSQPLIELITKQILHGNVKMDELPSGRFSFIPEGESNAYNLIECATGIKAISILLLLLQNNQLDKNTLLIIDEPEVHLHPEWVVEYARILVLLRKMLGVRLFIATHSPSMVRAIKYISEKEELEDSLNFYIAQPSTDSKHKNQFVFKPLETKISDIFKSFNKSIDKIEEYSSDEID